MTSRNPAVMAFARDVLAFVATASALLYYWGYLSVNAPLLQVFGYALPFPTQDYWTAGIRYLFSVGGLFCLGCIPGMIVAALNPEIERKKWPQIGLIAVAMGAILLFKSSTGVSVSLLTVLSAASAIACVGYSIGYFAALTVYTYSFVNDHERKITSLEALIDKDEEDLNRRQLTPEFSRLPNGTTLANQIFATEAVQTLRERLTVQNEKLHKTQENRRIARLILGVLTAFALISVACFFLVSASYVEQDGILRGIENRYPAVLMMVSTPIPQLTEAGQSATGYIYEARYVLQADGFVYLLSADAKLGIVIPTGDVQRMAPKPDPRQRLL